MATAAEALFSACLGVVGGVLGAGLIERLKAGVASLEVELVRIDTIEDEIFDVFETPEGEPDRANSLRRLAGKRRRLGQNIRRKVLDSTAYQGCRTKLVRLDDVLRKAEDATPLTDELEAEIETIMSGLRNQMRRSSRTARAFAFFRGDA